VETLLCAPEILRIGGPAFGAIGTASSTGTRLFCLSGCVERPSLYEYEFGVTLRQVIEAAGGVRGGRPVRAVLLGGAAGSFVAPEALDTPLTFEGVRAIGATLGSGVVLVLDKTVEITRFLRRIAQFFRDESCGQCVPCRVGTVRQEELLGRLVRGAPLGSAEREIALLDNIAAVARDHLDLRPRPDGGHRRRLCRGTRPGTEQAATEWRRHEHSVPGSAPAAGRRHDRRGEGARPGRRHAARRLPAAGN
jgi:NADH-quinone oxidoreductase subunit F